MSVNFLLYAVFISQIFIISYFLPLKLKMRADKIMTNYPPEKYPKLYPLSYAEIVSKIHQLMLLTYAGLGIGILIVMHGLYFQTDEMLGWDSQSVIMIFYIIQVIPLAFLALFGERYFKKMRSVNKTSIRTALLAPRSLTSYASKRLIGLAIIVYILFVILVAVISRYPFDGFAGYINVFGVTLLNGFFALIIFKYVYGKKIDPHQSDEDRFKQVSRVVKLMLFSSIAATLSISIHFLLSAFDLRHLNDVVASIYYQLIMLVMIMTSIKDNENFEVYKEASEHKIQEQ